MRQARIVAIVLLAGCRIGEYIAPPPIDAAVDGSASTVDAAVDGPAGFQGLRATIGERPEVTGSCDALDDRAEMEDRFDPPVAEQDVHAGWDFDTSADSYDDPSYGFDPGWASAQSGRFSVRFSGTIDLPPGTHCFAIDIGATGTGIIDGKNECGQFWIGNTVAETGYLAATAGPAEACLNTEGPTSIDIVFWYFNIFEQAILHVTVDGAPLSSSSVTPPSP